MFSTDPWPEDLGRVTAALAVAAWLCHMAAPVPYMRSGHRYHLV